MATSKRACVRCGANLSRYADKKETMCAPCRKTLKDDEVRPFDYLDRGTPEEAAWAYLNALDTEQLRVVAFPYVKDRMRSWMRDRARGVEDAAFPTTANVTEVDVLAARAKLVNETFTLSDGTNVGWNEATPAQHRERAEMQRRLAGNCLVDAERHEQAALLIEQCGVSCLAEIKDKAQAA